MDVTGELNVGSVYVSVTDACDGDESASASSLTVQSLTVRSREHVANMEADGDHAQPHIILLWALGILRASSNPQSGQSLTVFTKTHTLLSRDTLTRQLPSREKDMSVTVNV